MIWYINKPLLEQVVKDNSRQILVLDKDDTFTIMKEAMEFSFEKNRALWRIKSFACTQLVGKVKPYHNTTEIYAQAESGDYAFAVCGLLGREVSSCNTPYSKGQAELPLRGLTALGVLERLSQPTLIITCCDELKVFKEAKRYDNLLGYFAQPVNERKLLYVLTCYATGKMPSSKEDKLSSIIKSFSDKRFNQG